MLFEAVHNYFMAFHVICMYTFEITIYTWKYQHISTQKISFTAVTLNYSNRFQKLFVFTVNHETSELLLSKGCVFMDDSSHHYLILYVKTRKEAEKHTSIQKRNPPFLISWLHTHFISSLQREGQKCHEFTMKFNPMKISASKM